MNKKIVIRKLIKEIKKYGVTHIDACKIAKFAWKYRNIKRLHLLDMSLLNKDEQLLLSQWQTCEGKDIDNDYIYLPNGVLDPIRTICKLMDRNHEIKQKLKTKDYDFLREDKHLGDNICLLVIGGSRAYGTNNESSDIDIRGVTVDIPENVIGWGTMHNLQKNSNRFEQYVETETDTVIYSLSKFIELAAKGNPNILEMLGVRPSDVIYCNEFGRQLLENKHLFYSQRIISTISGYAESQLRRLDNALARDTLPQADKEVHIKNSVSRFLKNARCAFTDWQEDATIDVSIQDSKKETLDKELSVSLQLIDYPLRDLNGILQEMTRIVRDYDKSTKGHKNNKKDAAHLNKHAMHLVRLYLMGIEMLKDGECNTYRRKDLGLLMKIRNGYYMTSDGKLKKSFRDMINKLSKDFDKAILETKLPEDANIKKIEELKMDILFNTLKSKERLFEKRKDIHISNRLIRYFQRFARVNFPIVDADFFMYYVNLYDKHYETKRKWCEIQTLLPYFKSEEDFVNECYKVIDLVTDDIKDNNVYKKMVVSDLNEYSYEKKFSNKPPYIQANIDKYYLSIDLTSANVQALDYYRIHSLNREGTSFDYEDIINNVLKDKPKAFKKHILQNKYLREVIFGNLDCKKIVKIEKYMTDVIRENIMKYCKTLSGMEVVSQMHDELFIEVDKNFYDNGKNNLDEIISYVSQLGFDVHGDVFQLQAILNPKYGFIKNSINGTRFCGVPKYYLPQYIKYVNKQPITSEDLKFSFMDKYIVSFEKSIFENVNTK